MISLHSSALKSTKDRWAWGYNVYGGLGDGDYLNKWSPVSIVGGGHSFTSVINNTSFTNGLKSEDGSAWAWGLGTTGQLGDGFAVNRSSPVSVVGGHSFTSIVSGGTCITALKINDGSAWAWGLGTSGQLGDNTILSKSSPVSVVGGHSFASIINNGSFTTALKSDGSAWAWGLGTNAQLGQGSSAVSRSSPVSVVGGHSFASIINNSFITIGLKSADGSAWAWGNQVSTEYGQLGDGSIVNRSSPVSVVGGHSFASIMINANFTAGLKSEDGSAWAWGLGTSGQLGDGGIVNRSSPVSVVGGHSFASIINNGSFTTALKSDGSAWAWGLGTNAQLGQGSSAVSRSSPVSVVGGHSFASIINNANFTAGLKSEDGSVWAWGAGANGVLGDNFAVNRSLPVSVVGGHSFINVFNNQNFTTTLKSENGSAWAWGSETSGVLGNNHDATPPHRSSPVSVVNGLSFTRIASGYYHSASLKADGTCWTYGFNTDGEIGNNIGGTGTDVHVPTEVSGSHSFTNLVCGQYHNLTLKSDGSCWAWGLNTSGQLGSNSATARSSPVSVIGAHSFGNISAGQAFSLALKSNDGSGWAWGYNVYGGLGDGDYLNKWSPIQVVGGHSFTIVNNGQGFGLALKADDGSAWSWGVGTSGQLGDNTILSKSSPVSVVGGHSFTNIAGVIYHVVSLKESGECWTWGDNTYGELGNNSTALASGHKSSPISVVGNHSFVKAIGGGGSTFCSLGLKSDGGCWTWGDNTSGMLGDNSITSRSSPVSVVGGHSFIYIAGGYYGSAALKDDGTCWAWGGNTNGMLGDGGITSRSSPVSVVGDHSFVYIHTNCGSTLLALKSDGSAWAWGFGTSGQLGDNTILSKSSPVSVVGGHSFTSIVNNYSFTAGLKSDGSAWAWGTGDSGYLGNNFAVNRSSPVSVVGGHSFTSVVNSSNFTIGLKSEDGSAWAWGTEANGRLGNNRDANSPYKSSPVSVINGLSFTSISGGYYHSIGLVGTTCYAWGYNTTGQIGNNYGGAGTDVHVPTAVAGSHSFTKIASGDYHNLALKPDGSCWTWGLASSGQLGTNTISVAVSRSSPVNVMGNHSFSSIINSANFTTALKSEDGSAWAWGLGTSGQLGDNTILSKSSPVSVVGGHSFTSVINNANFTTGLKSEDGSVWAWGLGTSGQMGDNNNVSRSSPVSVVGGHSFSSIMNNTNFTIGLKSEDGSVWAWGFDQYSRGVLGDNTILNKSSPVSVVGGHSFANIIIDYINALALKSDGSAWSWGTGTSGQLGQGSIAVNRSSPVSIVGGHSFTSIMNTYFNKSDNIFGALKSDGSAWSWGTGTSGQLGEGSVAVSRSSPVSVVGGHSFTSIMNRPGLAMGLKSGDGSAWSWGTSTSGELGDNTILNKSSPVSVVGGHSFTGMIGTNTFTVCTKVDGSLWVWGGSATTGQLGDGNAVNRSSPVSVVGGHSFASVINNINFTTALKSEDGSAWAWGLGTTGQLGQGGIGSASSPVSVVGGHSFIEVAGLQNTSLALKANGDVWAWGDNTNGQLGDNSKTTQASPVLVIGGHNFATLYYILASAGMILKISSIPWGDISKVSGLAAASIGKVASVSAV